MKHFAGLVFLTLINLANSSLAQDIPLGTWRTHFSYLDAKHVVATESKLFCASELGFFSYDFQTGDKRKLSKIDGLSDVGVSSLAYEVDNGVLMVGYSSGYIDLISQRGITVVADIYESNLDREKTIFEIATADQLAYLGTGLGVVVLDVNTGDVKENYFKIGEGGEEVNVYDLTVDQSDIFILTDEGLQSGDLTLNLLDFNNWIRYPSTEAFRDITYLNDTLYATSGTDMHLLIEGKWQVFEGVLPDTESQLFSLGGNLYTASPEAIYRWAGTEFKTRLPIEATRVNDLAQVDGRFYMADQAKGLIDESGAPLSPDGPASNTFSRLKVLAGGCYGFNAPNPRLYGGEITSESYSVFENGLWSISSIPSFYNVSDVARIGGMYFFSSIGKGVYDASADEIITDLPESSAEPDTLITALSAFDGGIWASSFNASTPLARINVAGAPAAYSEGFLGGNQIETIDISELGVLWMKEDNQILLLDLFQEETDRITTRDGLPSSGINDVELSVEDDAWVATTKGPATFFSASSVIDNTSAALPTFENRFLFEDENVWTIKTDGGNRVWFGTERGLWLFDENTTELIARYTADNSPLPSDVIVSMAYNGQNGEMFIHTDKGLVSFRSSSSIGGESHRDVTAFPNPVRPDYVGLVGIKGLRKNVNVKITDVKGNLVKDLDANGGTASWDLTNLRGTSVSTGIYYFFSSSADGEETFVGKIAVIR